MKIMVVTVTTSSHLKTSLWVLGTERTSQERIGSRGTRQVDSFQGRGGGIRSSLEEGGCGFTESQVDSLVID